MVLNFNKHLLNEPDILYEFVSNNHLFVIFIEDHEEE